MEHQNTAELARGMYDPKLERLIDLAVSDGELTEKEKQVLFRKAQAAGIDLDEFEMVLDARMSAMQSSRRPEPSPSAPKSNKLGDIRKCPQCGAVIGSFQMVCPECGYEFSNVGANSFVEKFSRGLDELAANIKDDSHSSLFDIFDVQGVYADQRKEEALGRAELSYVQNYPLPMAKEDCIEMLNYILPKLSLSGSGRAAIAWKRKYDAIVKKMEIESISNPGLKDVVATYRAQGQVSTFAMIVMWYKSLSKITRTAIWFVLFYIVFFVALGGLAYNYL